MPYTGDRIHSRMLIFCIYLVACLVRLSSSRLIPNGGDSTERESVSSYDYIRDCAEVLAAGYNVSGRYMVMPDGAEKPFHVYCDMETDGGGWTVFQRREGGQVDFYRTWAAYKEGFGRVDEEHWLGNDKIRLLSAQKRSALRIELGGWDGGKQYAEYDWFLIEDEKYFYKLHLGTFSGTTEDDMNDARRPHNGQPFSTRDADHDSSSGNCAGIRFGGWWYSGCYRANLNGVYYEGTYSSTDSGPYGGRINGIVWFHYKNSDCYSLEKTEMKIRPVQSER